MNFLLNNIQGWAHNGYAGNHLMANVSIEDPLDINTLSGGAGAVGASSVGQEFVPEVWSQAILDKFQKKTMMLQLANDLSADAVGADKIHLPHVGVTPISSVTQGSAITPDTTSDSAGGGSDSMITTESTLEINEHKVTSLFIPDALKAQSSYNIFSLYTDQLAYAISRGVDNYLMNKVVANLTTVYGTTSGTAFAAADGTIDVGTALSSSLLGSLMEKCTTETGSMEGWSLVLGPKLYGSLANLDSGAGFVRGGAAPAGAGFTQTGVVGNILGMPVILSNSPYLDASTVSADADQGIAAWTGFDTDNADNDDAFRGFAVHQSAMYYAASQAPRVQQSYQHRYLADLITVDAIYGCTVRNSNTAGDRRIIGLIDNA
tara:strand:- start:119 stop:1246 length:1128 start_codon:yes stop_codon:yes gene_type:complete